MNLFLTAIKAPVDWGTGTYIAARATRPWRGAPGARRHLNATAKNGRHGVRQAPAPGRVRPWRATRKVRGELSAGPQEPIYQSFTAVSWRRDWDSNPGDALAPNGFQDRRLQPLGHPSARGCRPFILPRAVVRRRTVRPGRPRPRRSPRSPATPRFGAPSASPAHLRALAWYRPSLGDPPPPCRAGRLRAG